MYDLPLGISCGFGDGPHPILWNHNHIFESEPITIVVRSGSGDPAHPRGLAMLLWIVWFVMGACKLSKPIIVEDSSNPPQF